MCWVQLIQSFVVSFPTIASLYPSAIRDFEQGLKKCASISDQKFRKSKEQICQFVELSSRTMELDHPIREQLLRLVVEGGLQKAKDFLDEARGSSKKTESSFWRRTTAFVSGIFSKGDEDNYIITRMQEAVKGTPKTAREISDHQFLSDIVKSKMVQSSELSQLAEEAQRMAMSYLGSTISSLVKKVVLSAQSHREERYIADINTEIPNLEEVEQHRERFQFIHQVNRASNQDSYV